MPSLDCWPVGRAGSDGKESKNAGKSKDAETILVFNGVEIKEDQGKDIEKAGFISRVFLSWTSTLIYKGYRRAEIKIDDLWKLRRVDDPEMLSEEFLMLIEDYRLEDGTLRPYTIWRIAYRMFKWEFFLGGFFEVLYSGISFLGPIILRYIILEIQNGTAQSSRGYGLAAALGFTQAAGTLCQLHSRFYCVQIGLRLRNALSLATFKQVLRLEQEGRQGLSDGQVVNLVSTDAPVAVDFMRLFNRFWNAPLMVIGGIIYIYFYVGPSVFFGFAVMLAFMPISIKFGKVQTRLQRKKMMQTDTRVKTVNEMMQGIKVLKLYAWEQPLLEFLNGIRNIEMKAISTLTYYRGITMPFAVAMPNIASVITFCAFILLGNEITPADTFTVVSAWNIIRGPFIALPLAIIYLTRAFVSAHRFRNFFELKINSSNDTVVAIDTQEGDENINQSRRVGQSPSFEALDPENHGGDGSARALPYAVEVHNANFTWSINTGVKPLEKGLKGKFTRGEPSKKSDVSASAVGDTEGGKSPEATAPFKLEDINFSIPTGSLVAIVGRIGDGKSSLLSALLGEMRPVSGTVNIHGSMALCQQEPFIMNRTVRENILFEAPMDEARYNATIEACSLTSDLETLPAGDLTEIGERGVNLSGGQKARVSLARAVYAQPDVIFLDDVLSAVDAHVGKHIFDHCISNKPRSVLRGTTRLFVTNHLHLLKYMDSIIFLKDGRIADQGTYDGLVSRGSPVFDALPPSEDNARDSFSEVDTTGDRTRENSTVDLEDAFNELERRISSKLSEGPSEIERRKSSQLSSASISSRSNVAHGSYEKSGGDIADGDDVLSEDDADSTRKKGTLVKEEERQKGALKFEMMKRYFLAGTGDSYIGVFSIIAIFFVTEGVFLSMDSWLARYSEEDSDNPTTSKRTFLLVYFFLMVGYFCILMTRAVVYAAFSIKACRTLYENLQANVFYLPMSFFWQTPLGRILNRLSKDTNDIDVMLSQQLKWFMMMSVRVLGVVVLICMAAPIFAVAIVPFVIIYGVLRELYRRTAVNVQRIESVLRSPVYSHLGETLQGAATLKAFRRKYTWINVANTLIGLNNRALLAVEATQIWLTMRLEFLGALIVFITAVAIIGSDAEPGMAGLALSYSLSLVSNLQMTVTASSQVEAKMNAVERVIEYAEIPNEKKLDEGSSSPPPEWPNAGAIRFDNVTLRYRENLEPALRDVSFEVPAGCRVAIVGATGSGKSTALVALFRLVYPLVSGRLLIDEIDIATVPVHRLRSMVTCIPQDPVLFSSTLRKNLDPFEMYSDEEIWSAIDKSHLRKTVEALPDGLVSAVSQGGENLSVGERQLICIARAILRKSKIVLLDEASASLDRQTDALIQDSIRSSFPDCTMLVIAHRLETVVDMDRCLVMNQGRVAEYGSFDELLANDEGHLTQLFAAAGIDRINYRDAKYQVHE